MIAGPGTGKTHAVQKRALNALQEGADPSTIYVISFTRATCAELGSRIVSFCVGAGYTNAAKIHVSTMHSLGLSLLRRGRQLTHYPHDPVVLDDWEQARIFDHEFSASFGCSPTRAKQIREAFDVAWHTLNPALIDQAEITETERTHFSRFHNTRTNLYSCVLPGEIIFKCVEALEYGDIGLEALDCIRHLIVDEYQDLNDCDQRFVELLVAGGAQLFVAGDDDQSIYMSLRHANPNGIIRFNERYPGSRMYNLTNCFRCTPSVLQPAQNLIAYNEGRLDKALVSLYSSSEPIVRGTLRVWSFTTAREEAQAVAESCRALIEHGMQGREDEIVILISSRKILLDLLSQELANLGLPFEPPAGKTLTEDDAIRAIYCILRLLRDRIEANQQKPDREKRLDYPAYRSLICLLSGVGPKTATQIATLCISNQCNFHDLFYQPRDPYWLTGTPLRAINRIRTIITEVGGWQLNDTVGDHINDLSGILERCVFPSCNQSLDAVQRWFSLASALPQEMSLNEFLEFLAADTESDQETILELVRKRLGIGDGPNEATRKIRLLTMHGSKGLNGAVVFIPSTEQGIMPSFRALRATGLLMEHRRLFYVSLTRARAACIISHAVRHEGAHSYALSQKSSVMLSRSEFLTQMAVRSDSRSSGLTALEAEAIVDDVRNL